MKKLALFLLFLTFSTHTGNTSKRNNSTISRHFIMGFQLGLGGTQITGISGRVVRIVEAGQGNVLGLRLWRKDSAFAEQLLNGKPGQVGEFTDRFKSMVAAGTLKISYSQ
jgi:hypothetical protein